MLNTLQSFSGALTERLSLYLCGTVDSTSAVLTV
jgi:hypothetical protein